MSRKQKIDFQQDDSNPSAADVIDAFARAYDKEPRRLTFRADEYEGGAVEMRITGLNYESGSPGMFIIQGDVQTKTIGLRAMGFYDANRRGGYVELD